MTMARSFPDVQPATPFTTASMMGERSGLVTTSPALHTGAAQLTVPGRGVRVTMSVAAPERKGPAVSIRWVANLIFSGCRAVFAAVKTRRASVMVTPAGMPSP